METNIKTVALDMDGVIVDFNAGIARKPDIINEFGVPWYSDTSEMYQKDFFINLKPLANSIESVEKLFNDYNIDLHIASKPIPNSFCAVEKFQWIEKYIPALINKTHLLQEKGLLLTNYLVDDDMRWKDKFKGSFIHFHTFNPEKSWESVFEHLKDYKK